MEYVTIAKLLSTHGLKGQFRCFSLTSFPKERFQLRRKLTLHNPKTDEKKDVTLNFVRMKGDILILGFEEIPTIDEAENFVKWELDINKEDAPIPEDHYRIADLIGCDVYDDETNQVLGEIKDVFSYSPTWTIRVKREEQKDFFVPFVNEFIKEVDTAKKKVVIHVIPGLL